jgi:hypothetical protein
MSKKVLALIIHLTSKTKKQLDELKQKLGLTGNSDIIEAALDSYYERMVTTNNDDNAE